MIGSRPPTESLSEIKAASLLEKNPRGHDRAPLFLQMETVLGSHLPKV